MAVAFKPLQFSGRAVALVLLVLCACQVSSPEQTSDEALMAFSANGGSREKFLLGRKTFREVGCIRCHRREGVGTPAAPNLDQVALRKDPLYVKQSILEPEAVIVPGYGTLKMPLNFGEILEPEQIDALVYYLLSNP